MKRRLAIILLSWWFLFVNDGQKWDVFSLYGGPVECEQQARLFKQAGFPATCVEFIDYRR